MDTGVTALEKFQMHIGGEWVDAASGETFETDNPFTAEPSALLPKIASKLR
jgi:acyl-CoA reductase-like NAD-dependent aldehyde dehydrogenase